MRGFVVTVIATAGVGAAALVGFGLSAAIGGSSEPAPLAMGGSPVHTASFTGGIPFVLGTQAGTFFSATVRNFVYDGSHPIILSRLDDGTGDTLVSYTLILHAVHADGSTSTLRHDYGTGCGRAFPLPPADVSQALMVGLNRVSVTLNARCSDITASQGSTALWLVPRQSASAADR
jgi:hypothetical protein